MSALGWESVEPISRWVHLFQELVFKTGPLPTINLPNLWVRNVYFPITPISDPHAIADIANAGVVRTDKSFKVRFELEITRGSRVHAPLIVEMDAGPLDPGQVQIVEATFQGLKTLHLDAVKLTVTVDPPTTGRPGGSAWEANEQDNVCIEKLLVQEFPPPLGSR